MHYKTYHTYRNFKQSQLRAVMKLFLIFISLFSTNAFSQENLTPAQKQGACYAACARQTPPASCSQKSAARFEKYSQEFQKNYAACNTPNISVNDFKSCLIAKGFSKDNAEFFLTYGRQSRLIRENNLSNSDMGAIAMQMCM